MINHLMEKKRQEEGFTLIEMLIVVIILGILAAVVVFGVSTFRDDSVEKACETDRKQAETAVTAYVAKNGKAPAEVGAGQAPAGVEGTYIKTWPSNTDYRMQYDTPGDAAPTGSTFTIVAQEQDAANTWVAYAACN